MTVARESRAKTEVVDYRPARPFGPHPRTHPGLFLRHNNALRLALNMSRPASSLERVLRQGNS
jgi:hypothetical protein